MYIARGTSTAGAIDSIAASASITSPFLIKLATRITARVTGRSVHVGWYVFAPGQTSWDIVQSLLSGRGRPTVRVTIPEGLTYRECASLLQTRAEVDSAGFVQWCENDSVVALYAPNAPSMEGYLMPDTYDVLWRESPADVGSKLASYARSMWRSLYGAPENRHTTLTLASIVQAEAAQVDEMPTIAGVYANRLRRGLKLEADPTVQYGIGWKKRVLYRHLADVSPYNTYVHHGLPPGPICNPSKKAVEAALRPENHTFIFFVARGDGSGRHRFASNASEHIQNVRRYRATRR